MISFIAAGIALVGTCIASCIDIKTKEIPNVLTFSMIFIGIILFLWRIFIEKEWAFVPPLILSYIFIWLIWKAGYWGGGDAKLLMGILTLVPSLPNISFFIPSFFIMLGIISILHFFTFGFIAALRRGMRKKFVLATGSVFAISMTIYFLSKIFLPSFSIFLAIVAFAIGGDIMSSFLPCTKEIPLSEAEGELLAERIVIVNEEVIRIKESPSLIRNIFSKKEKIENVIAYPRHMGITKDEIEKLRDHCSHVTIFITCPFAPIIFTALILTLIFGNVFDKIFTIFS